jgi:hypothetical protein
MKLTKATLKKIIKEEIGKTQTLNEDPTTPSYIDRSKKGYSGRDYVDKQGWWQLESIAKNELTPDLEGIMSQKEAQNIIKGAFNELELDLIGLMTDAIVEKLELKE